MLLDDYSIGQQLFLDGWDLSECENLEQRIGFIEYSVAIEFNEQYIETIN